jgi:CubicO group peptidase (beta-lactamase class C family)
LLLLCSVATVLFFAASCEGKGRQPYDLLSRYNQDMQYYPAERWQKIAAPELAGWSSAALEEARRYSESIHSSAVVIVDNGVIVAEWGNIATRHNIHSVRKSLMNAMIGIAVDDRDIDPAATLKMLKITDIGGLSPAETDATVHDLLTSRSGIYHRAAYETEGMEEKRPARGSHPPGTFWYYNNWDFNTLATIFNEGTGKDFFEEFRDRIAIPLRMEHFRLEDARYQFEPAVSEHPAYLFRMTALDLARFGLLYARNGLWQGQQLISADWISRSTEKHTVLNPKHPERGYGYLWWIDEGVYYASGTGGQRLFVIPSLGVVIVHQVNTDSHIRVKSTPIWKLFDMIIKARSDNARPPHKEADKQS